MSGVNGVGLICRSIACGGSGRRSREVKLQQASTSVDQQEISGASMASLQLAKRKLFCNFIYVRLTESPHQGPLSP